jgi:hypothetical protein
MHLQDIKNGLMSRDDNEFECWLGRYADQISTQDIDEAFKSFNRELVCRYTISHGAGFGLTAGLFLGSALSISLSLFVSTVTALTAIGFGAALLATAVAVGAVIGWMVGIAKQAKVRRRLRQIEARIAPQPAGERPAIDVGRALISLFEKLFVPVRGQAPKASAVEGVVMGATPPRKARGHGGVEVVSRAASSAGS